jgi:hypothetical protein
MLQGSPPLALPCGEHNSNVLSYPGVREPLFSFPSLLCRLSCMPDCVRTFYNLQQRMCSDKVVVEADVQVGATDMPYSTPMGGLFSRIKQAAHEV